MILQIMKNISSVLFKLQWIFYSKEYFCTAEISINVALFYGMGDKETWQYQDFIKLWTNWGGCFLLFERSD